MITRSLISTIRIGDGRLRVEPATEGDAQVLIVDYFIVFILLSLLDARCVRESLCDYLRATEQGPSR